jgi:hypothetical protein
VHPIRVRIERKTNKTDFLVNFAAYKLTDFVNSHLWIYGSQAVRPASLKKPFPIPIAAATLSERALWAKKMAPTLFTE